MLLMALIGFLIVFFVLVLMIGVMKAMGYVFTHQRKAKKVAAGGSAEDEDHAISDAEIVAVETVKLFLLSNKMVFCNSEFFFSRVA